MRRIFIFIPVSRRIKGYTSFVEKYVTGRRKRFRPHKVYIILIRITSQVDLAMSVRMNAEILETIRARLLGFGMQIPELLTQRKFVSAAFIKIKENIEFFKFFFVGYDKFVYFVQILSSLHNAVSHRFSLQLFFL